MEYDILAKNSETASILLHKYFYDTINEIEELQRREFNVDLFNFQQLLITCQFTSESLYILISNNRIWDAEILFRTLLEGTLKALYISIGTIEEKTKKIKEFWMEIPLFNSMKGSDKAQTLLNSLGGCKDENLSFFRDMIIEKDELDLHKQRYSRKYRRGVEKRWAFNNMLVELVTSDIQDSNMLLGLTYPYFTASSLSHMDAYAINMIRERNTRDKDRREIVEISHGLRMIIDILSLSLFRSHCFRMFVNQKSKNEYKIGKKHRALIRDYQKYNEKLNRIEKEYENRMKDKSMD